MVSLSTAGHGDASLDTVWWHRVGRWLISAPWTRWDFVKSRYLAPRRCLRSEIDSGRRYAGLDRLMPGVYVRERRRRLPRLDIYR